MSKEWKRRFRRQNKNSLLKAGALIVLGMLLVATTVIIAAGRDVSRDVLVMFALVGGCGILLVSRRKILPAGKTFISRVDETIKEDPLGIGGAVVSILIVCILAGGGVYRFLGGEVKDLEPFFYPLGVVVVALTFLGIERYTDSRPPSR